MRRLLLIIIFTSLLFVPSLYSSEELQLSTNDLIQIPQELQNKIESGYLIRNISNKITQIKNGVKNDKTEYAKVVLFFSEYPSNSIIKELQIQGVQCYMDSWIPPLQNHPYGFIHASIPTESFLDVLPTSEIIRIASGERRIYAQNNRGYKATNADDVWSAGWDGTGVKVAVLDSGLDSFYDGTDMPSSYDKKDYSDYPALDNNVENTHSRTGHGTHVAGTVLGRGSLSSTNTINGGGAYKGIAPDADLCFLKIEHDTNGGASNAAINGALTAAVSTYDADIITMSYGGWSTYHDGSDDMCQTADWCYDQGVPVFVSAGNDANDEHHYSGTVNANSESGYIQINTNAGSALTFNLVWYDGLAVDNVLDLEYYNSSYTELTSVTDHGITESTRGTESRLSNYNSTVSAGTYYLKVTNSSSNNQDFHIYFDDWGYSDITFQNSDPYYTCGSPAEADNVFAVGAWTTDRGWTAYNGSGYYFSSETNNDISTFSDRGPRIDGAQKPQLTAPGASVISIRDTDVYTTADPYWVDNNGDTTAPHNYYVMLGTSMSCPMVAGAAALLLDRWPGVSPQQVYNALQNNALVDGFTGSVPNDTWGYGKLDIYAAIYDDSALPVTLSSFNVSFTNDRALLVWVTQSETQNAGWNIYRAESTSSEQRYLINSDLISGAGTASEPTEYSFTDQEYVISEHTYLYWLESISNSGESEEFGPIALTIPYNENNIPENPDVTLLKSNFPNPFNPETSISFIVMTGEEAELTIYNMKGQKLITEYFQTGSHNYNWNASEYGTGIYYYKLTSDSYDCIKKMLMMK